MGAGRYRTHPVATSAITTPSTTPSTVAMVRMPELDILEGRRSQEMALKILQCSTVATGLRA
jgi:hypothetical protein